MSDIYIYSHHLIYIHCSFWKQKNREGDVLDSSEPADRKTAPWRLGLVRRQRIFCYPVPGDRWQVPLGKIVWHRYQNVG